MEGIHCARCIWAIESALAKEDAVEEARVNMSTKRLVITWQGAAEMADHLANVVLELGYKVQPFEKRTEGKELREDQRLLRYMAVAGFAMGNLMLLSVT
ncbi:MAG: heavy metal translocating P-type ATPase, partial [Rickettsiales bacterium]|nr:heavy metal translocating P-type ATPase [Rickettsiales bacterium]